MGVFLIYFKIEVFFNFWRGIYNILYVCGLKCKYFINWFVIYDIKSKLVIVEFSFFLCNVCLELIEERIY